MNSNLQIISGIYRGRKLCLPGDARPTQNKTRIALFNMITPLIKNAPNVWDVFCGSGAFGAEFLSRYENAKVIFTDVNIDAVKKNINDERAQIVKIDALTVVKKFALMSNVIFVDAPWDKPDLGKECVNEIAKFAKVNTLIVWELESNMEINIPKNMTIIRDKKYGRARIIIALIS